MASTLNVYIDGNHIVTDGIGGFRVDVLANGADGYSTEKGNTKYFSWTYSGEGAFLGLSENSAAVTPDSGLAVGESKTYSTAGTYYFYSVASSSGGGGSDPLATITYKDTSTELGLEESATLATEGKYLLHDIVIQFDGGTGGN